MARVFVTDTLGEAEVRVAVVEEQGFADLLVHRVGTRGQARGDERWYLTDSRGDATCRVFLCSPGMSELIVCMVDTYGAAGWTRKHRLRGRLANRPEAPRQEASRER